MKRFFGMMPSNEVEKQKCYKDQFGLTVTIEAGPNGWSVIFADGGSIYHDKVATTEINFDEAYNEAVKSLGDLVEEDDAIEEG